MICAACGHRPPDDGRFCPRCGAPLPVATPPMEARKNVTVLFIDLVGSTALAEQLDPEALRQIMDRYFSGCSAAIAGHGGMVEKFIGDAVMAVFGALVSHEDDAVRAVRAAAGSLAALDTLAAELWASHRVSLAARCGICSGEAVVITSGGGEVRVVGDPVNTASRLQAAAGAGGILVCAGTRALLRSRVGLEPVAPLELKGKAHAVPAWAVTSPCPDTAGAAEPRAPMLGREAEMEELTRCYQRAVRHRQTCLATVLGAPGIGKSRLVQEFVAALLAREDVCVLSGRCSAYGRGVTYQPLAQMVRSFPGGWPGLAAALAAEPDLDDRAVQCLAAIAGQPGRGPAGRPGPALAGPAGVEEISWAVRHMLDILGRARPVVMVWDDLNAAESTLLDLIDDIASWLADVPVLLLCVARTELLESQPSWGGGKACAVTLELGPLTESQSAALIEELMMSGEVQPHLQHDVSQLALQCDGNPLFAELMLDVLAEAAPSDPGHVPPTIQAVLGARLDQLPADERLALEIAAAIGGEFTHEAVFAVTDAEGLDRSAPREALTRLVRKRLIQRSSSGGLRFTQVLLRDTAYAFTPKSRRSHWHAVLAGWHAGRIADQGDPPSLDDRLAFVCHVEAACRLRRELLTALTGLGELASSAAGVLLREGDLALARKDLPAAATLLERARDLLPPGDPRHLTAGLHACDASLGLLDAARAHEALSAAEAALPEASRGRMACAVQQCVVDLRLGLQPLADISAKAALLAEVLANDPADDLSWCRYHQLMAHLHLAGERTGQAEASLRLALDRARSLDDSYEEARLLCAICEVSQWAPSPVSAGLELCDTLSRRFSADRALLVPVLVTRAHLAALAGNLTAARQALGTALRHAGDLHLDLANAAVMEMSGLVASLAGDHLAAEDSYRRAADALAAAQQARDAQPLRIAIARELVCQGRSSEAAVALDALEAGGELLPRVRLMATALRALIASAAADQSGAVALARQAVALSSGTDDLCLAGEALFAAARVLAAAGLPGEAASSARAALRAMEAKGAALPAAAVRGWLATRRPGWPRPGGDDG